MGEVGPGCGAAPAPYPGRAPTILDINAPLHEIHPEHKEQAAANYKGS